MSEATRQEPFAKVGPGRMPMPPWLKMPLIGASILGGVTALTWVFVIPHKVRDANLPKVDWSVGAPLKIPADTGEVKPDKVAEQAKPTIPGPTSSEAPPARPFRAMQVWGADGGNAPIVLGGVGGSGASNAPYARPGPGQGWQTPSATGGQGGGFGGPGGAGGSSEYGSMLTPTAMHETEARVIHDRSLLLPESKSFECVPDAPQDNQYPGGISCTVGEDVWSSDGSNILIDRWATVSGQITRGQGLGQDRGFILWTRVRSNRVTAELNSPATDQQGQMGVPGILDEHWWQRIKAATMLTGIQTTGNVVQNLASRGNGNSYLNFGQEQSLASQALQHDINIPATFWRGQGWPLRIYIQHDVQFRRTYNNKLVASAAQ